MTTGFIFGRNLGYISYLSLAMILSTETIASLVTKLVIFSIMIICAISKALCVYFTVYIYHIRKVQNIVISVSKINITNIIYIIYLNYKKLYNRMYINFTMINY